MTSALVLALLLQPKPTIDQVVQEFRIENKVAGISVAVWEGDDVIAASTSGYHDEAAGTQMSPVTLIRLASISKAITGTGVMLLAQQGKIDLDKPIKTYVPE